MPIHVCTYTYLERGGGERESERARAGQNQRPRWWRLTDSPTCLPNAATAGVHKQNTTPAAEPPCSLLQSPGLLPDTSPTGPLGVVSCKMPSLKPLQEPRHHLTKGLKEDARNVSHHLALSAELQGRQKPQTSTLKWDMLPTSYPQHLTRAPASWKTSLKGGKRQEEEDVAAAQGILVGAELAMPRVTCVLHPVPPA